MLCSSQFLMKRCYLLYIFIAIAILLLLFCIYLYKKYTKQNNLENIEVSMNLQEKSSNLDEIVENKETEKVLEDSQQNMERVEIETILEPEENEAREDAGLIRKPLENEEENQKVKENERKTEVGEDHHVTE